MAVLAETLRKLRKRAGLSQQDLAERSKVSKRTIARLEQGISQAENRTHTIRSLARALKVEAEVLGAPIADDGFESADASMQRVMTFVTSWTMLDYDMVRDRYGVSLDALVWAAPWMFALLAEMSLKDRRSRLSAAQEALAQMQATTAPHLGLRKEAPADLAERFEKEAKSIEAGDVFGSLLSEPDSWPEVDETPFAAFLAERSRDLGSSVVKPEALQTELFEPLPSWSIHIAWLEELVGGDRVARHVLYSGLARVGDIPAELRQPGKVIERVDFLRKLVSPKDQKRIEQSDFIFTEST